MRNAGSLLRFVVREWILVSSVVALVLVSICNHRLPRYSADEFEVLFILFALFVAVRGLQNSGLVSAVSWRISGSGNLPLKLVGVTFLLSMFLTNDVALLVVVPLTLSLGVGHRGLLVILEALAANAGSAATPFGNPQNLFLYWHYDLRPGAFVLAIAPFSVFFLLLLVLTAWLSGRRGENLHRSVLVRVERPAAVRYGILLLVVLCTVLRILPVPAAGAVLLYAACFDRDALRVDYVLLATFFAFFGVAGELSRLLAARIRHCNHVFLFSALSSQVIGNVPSALLFADFTNQWKSLLWGTNVGGFGSLFGSFANLIAFRLYVTNDAAGDTGRFTLAFLALGLIAFFLGVGLYFVAGRFL